MVSQEYCIDILLWKFGKRFAFINSTFKEIDHIHITNKNIKAIIFDLGYSTIQIKDLSKGLSFQSKGKLKWDQIMLM